MSPRELLVISFSLSNNGAERVFVELSNEWIRRGHPVTVIQFEKDAYGGESFALDPQIREITLNRKSIGNKLLRYLRYLTDIRGYLRKNPDAVVIAYSFTTQMIVVAASAFLRNTIIFSERNDPNNCPYSKASRLLRNLSYHRAARIVFQTGDAKDYFPETIRKKGVVITNPINPSLPERFAGERRKAIVTAARLRPQKNLPLLIEAYERFHRNHPDYCLEIYGIGEELDSLKSLAREKRIEDKVFFMGFCPDFNERVNDAAIYACSSDYEGIS
ncbi:MAG: glycosyltransferase, partial [Oscillospiraceae bacterium]|nr:glycosyltransferase [Oscillospiraceae bacterium]